MFKKLSTTYKILYYICTVPIGTINSSFYIPNLNYLSHFKGLLGPKSICRLSPRRLLQSYGIGYDRTLPGTGYPMVCSAEPEDA